MGSLNDSIKGAAKRETSEKESGFLKRVFKFGRLGKEVLFDPPGVNPTKFRIEILNRDEVDACMQAAYIYTAEKLGGKIQGRIEDCDMYDQRLMLETLLRAVKDPESPVVRDEQIVRYYAAAQSVDDFGKLSSEQLAYLYRQYQLVCMEFSPTKAQLLAMTDIAAFCEQCAKSAEEEGDGFLALASLSWQEAITLVGTLAVQLNQFLVPSLTPSNLVSTSKSGQGTSSLVIASSTESPSLTSLISTNDEVKAQLLDESLPSSKDSQTEAEDLAKELNE